MINIVALLAFQFDASTARSPSPFPSGQWMGRRKSTDRNQIESLEVQDAVHELLRRRRVCKENWRAAVNHLSRRKISGPKNCQPTSSFGGEKMIDPSHGLFYFVLDRSEETQCFIVNCVILTQPRNHISLLCLHLLKSLALAWKCCWDKRVSCPVAEEQAEERQSQDRMVNQVTAVRQTQLG